MNLFELDTNVIYNVVHNSNLNNSPEVVNIKTVAAGVSFKDFSLIFFNATFKVWISVANLFLPSKI